MQLSDDSDSDDPISPAQRKRKLSNPSNNISPPTSLPSRRSRRLQQVTSSSPLGKIPRRSKENVADLQSSPPRRSGRLQTTHSSSKLQLNDSDSSATLASPNTTTADHVNTNFSDLGSPETSDDDVVMVTKPKSRRKSKLDVDDPFIVNNDDLQYESDGIQRKDKTEKKKTRGDAFVVDDDDVEFISSEDEISPTVNHKRRTSRRDDDFIADDDDVVDAEEHGGLRLQSLTRPRAKALKNRRARTQQEQNELDEDLQDLQDSDHEIPKPKARRTRGGPVTTKKDKAREHLDLLKRRRAGEKMARVADSEEDSEDEQEGADINFIGKPDETISDEGSLASETDSEPGVGNLEDKEVEDDFIEDEFIENDTEGRLGRPNRDIPLQFTNFASKKPKELFIHIIEWMVKNKIAPAFNRNDPVYNLALSRVDDQVKAQAGSRLISAAWGSEFKNAILARPNMSIQALPGEDDDHIRTCDACNRSNNPARYEFVLSGEPYYSKTLEPVDNSDEDEDEDEDETDDHSVTYDEAGHAIASSGTRFYLGRFCAANAQMGHKLTHWKWNLNNSLMEYLESQGVLSADAIVAREKMNKKQREKEAENIVDEMEDTGQIAEFWDEFGNDLDDARIGMEDYQKKGGRTKGRVGAIRSKRGRMVTEWDKDKVRTRIAMESDSEGE